MPNVALTKTECFDPIALGLGYFIALKSVNGG